MNDHEPADVPVEDSRPFHRMMTELIPNPEFLPEFERYGKFIQWLYHEHDMVLAHRDMTHTEAYASQVVGGGEVTMAYRIYVEEHLGIPMSIEGEDRT